MPAPEDRPESELSAVRAAIHGLYHDAPANPGETVERGRYGLYFTGPADPDLDRVVVASTCATDVDALLRETRSIFGNRQVRVYVDDPVLDDALRPALEAGGCRRTTQLSYLVHRGPPPPVEAVDGLVVRDAETEADLRASEVVRLQAFAHSEAPPDAGEVTANLAGLVASLDTCRYRVGRMDGEAVTTVGWYEADHRVIFNLATRVPFRRRGLARHLLARLIDETRVAADRSLTIFTDPEDGPVAFYRGLGFTAEVYWQARYRYLAPGAG